MTPAQKTVAILGLASAVVGGTSLLLPHSAGSHSIVTSNRPAQTPVSGHATASVNGFALRADLESSYLLRGSSESHMAVTVSSPTIDERRRPAVDIAVVLDRSGSMSGDKLDNAKLAADRLLAQLGSGDRFTIIAYGTDVEVVHPMSDATKAQVTAAQRAIQSIRDDGGTNLSGGMLAARDQLSRATRTEGVARVERIVLISDGKANEGIVGSDSLAQLAEETANAGTSITTVGVGLDYDETVMTRMAVSGRGNYYFVESSSELKSMFAEELGNLGNTTATSVTLSIRPAGGVEVLEAYGYELKSVGTGFEVPIADLRSGDTRKVVLRLRTDTKAGVEHMDLAKIEASLVRTKDEKDMTLGVTVNANFTESTDVVANNRNADAVRHVERARTAADIVKATELYERGKAEEAQKVLEQRRAQVKAAAVEIGDDGLERELGAATKTAEGNMKSAGSAPSAPRSTKGKRARKLNRRDAYRLAR